MLEAQSAEVSTLILDRQPLQIDVLLNEVISDLELIARQHRITISKNISTELPLAFADQTQIWRVFNNLISNAVKHNPHGTKVEIVAEEIIDRDRNWIRCNVCDDGIGIPPNQLPLLFNLYARGQRAKRMPGLGLGLYLCQQIISAHHGEIGVNNRPTGGIVFWFTLPVYDQKSQFGKQNLN